MQSRVLCSHFSILNAQNSKKFKILKPHRREHVRCVNTVTKRESGIAETKKEKHYALPFCDERCATLRVILDGHLSQRK